MPRLLGKKLCKTSADSIPCLLKLSSYDITANLPWKAIMIAPHTKAFWFTHLISRIIAMQMKLARRPERDTIKDTWWILSHIRKTLRKSLRCAVDFRRKSNNSRPQSVFNPKPCNLCRVHLRKRLVGFDKHRCTTKVVEGVHKVVNFTDGPHSERNTWKTQAIFIFLSDIAELRVCIWFDTVYLHTGDLTMEMLFISWCIMGIFYSDQTMGLWYF